MALVVNLFGAPGSGKSTGAAYIFSKLKMLGYNAELVTEYAKDKVWEGNTAVFNSQGYIFGKQNYRMIRCNESVDIIVTDSPILLSKLYNNEADDILRNNWDTVFLDTFNSYENVNFLLQRVKEYNPIGRHQNEFESDAVGLMLRQMLNDDKVEYTLAKGTIEDYEKNCYLY